MAVEWHRLAALPLRGRTGDIVSGEELAHLVHEPLEGWLIGSQDVVLAVELDLWGSITQSGLAGGVFRAGIIPE